MNTSDNRYSSRRDELQARKQRLQTIASAPYNRVCSECPERHPTWASLLVSPSSSTTTEDRDCGESSSSTDDDKRIGVLCCYQCYSYHFQLGKTVCSVKNIKMVEEWTEEEIEAMERGGGNQIMNAIFEAKLRTFIYDKMKVLEDVDDDQAARKAFVQYKYQQRRYFDERLYRTQLQRFQKNQQQQQQQQFASDSPPSVPFPRPVHHEYTSTSSIPRRARSFDNTGPSASKDFVRKPIRRRSQSFHKDRFETDGESTDDDQRVSYNLPGFLGAQLAATITGGRPTSLGGFVTAPVSTAKARKQRRDSLRALRLDSMEQSTLGGSGEGLGYGGEDNPMDATSKVSNTNARRKNRRKSLPSMHAMLAEGDNSCAAAPKMPQRFMSDESGSDTDAGFVTPPPNIPMSGRRGRRLSMPLLMTDDDDDDTLSGGVDDIFGTNNANTYSPRPMAASGRLSDSSGRKSYGMDLGYGFDDSSKNNSVQVQELLVEAAAAVNAVKPKLNQLIPRRSSTGDAVYQGALPVNQNTTHASSKTTTSISQQPPTLLPLPEDLGYEDEPDITLAVDRKALRRRRRRKSGSRMPGLERCSTAPAGTLGATANAICGSDPSYDSVDSSDGRKPRRARRRSSAGASMKLATVACVDDLGYEDMECVDTVDSSIGRSPRRARRRSSNGASLMLATIGCDDDLGYEDMMATTARTEALGDSSSSFSGRIARRRSSAGASLMLAKAGFNNDLGYGEDKTAPLATPPPQARVDPSSSLSGRIPRRSSLGGASTSTTNTVVSQEKRFLGDSRSRLTMQDSNSSSIYSDTTSVRAELQYASSSYIRQDDAGYDEKVNSVGPSPICVAELGYGPSAAALSDSSGCSSESTITCVEGPAVPPENAVYKVGAKKEFWKTNCLLRATLLNPNDVHAD